MMRGFTLLEMMAATVIMGIAVVGLLSGISTSMRNAGRLTDYDRGVLLARSKMGELLVDRSLPRDGVFEGRFDPNQTGGAEGGWKAHISPFETPPAPAMGAWVLDRVELEVWWISGGERRSFRLDGYRQSQLLPAVAP